MSDDQPRKSRMGWPGPMSVAGLGEGHTHELPAPLLERVETLTRRQRRQTFTVAVLSVCLVGISVLLLLIIFERGEARDQQNEELRQMFCTTFDTLPEGAPLDEARDQFGCGPGRPLESFPEDVRRRYTGESAPTPAPATTAPTTAPAPTTTQPPQPTPNEPPAGNSPKPTPDPTTPPSGVLEPVTDTVCDLLPICIEEP